MAATLLVAVSVAILVIILLRSWWSSRNSTLTNWPLFGITPSIVYNISQVHDFFDNLLRENGGTFHVKGPWFSGMDFLSTCDPTNFNYFLNTNFANYHKGDEFRDMLEPLGDGILAADADDWRNQRRTLQSLFHDKKFKSAVEKIVSQKISNGLFSVLESASKLGTVVDLQDIMRRLTFDNICVLILGLDPNCLSVDFPEVAVETAFHDMEEAILFRHFLPSPIWKLQRTFQIGKEKSLTTGWKIVDQFVADCIAKEREKLGRQEKCLETDSDDFSVLKYFLTSSADEENGIQIKSDKFLIDLAFNLLSAGRDTIAAALVWFFWLVGTHPHVESKLLEEMEENLPREKNGRKSTIFRFEELNKLTYLQAVVSEVLRLYPSLPINHIVSIDEDTLPSGHQIPKNQMILYSLYSTGRIEEIWGKDCLQFKPERWISNKGEIVHVPSNKFIAFNTGPRSCLGKNLTFLQMKAIATAIMWNYKVDVVQDYAAQPDSSVVLYMRDGLKIRVSERFGS